MTPIQKSCCEQDGRIGVFSFEGDMKHLLATYKEARICHYLNMIRW
jgi:hypothetical protein